MFFTPHIADARKARWEDPTLTWGLVPTMGYLHEGHLSLVRRARADNDRVAVSVFVNPTQFAPDEDLSTYPRDLEQDMRLLRAEGVDLAFVPSVAEMYGKGFQTTIVVQDVTKRLEGASRPSHFLGVATVVTKLLNIIQPTTAYFGQKDIQQTIVIRRMVADLNINSRIAVCPTMRESDGLAMSSRNAYLSSTERQAATVLYKALQTAKHALDRGERNGEHIRRVMRRLIHNERLARIDYVSLADIETLEELDMVETAAVASLAVFIGRTRLIDNLIWREL